MERCCVGVDFANRGTGGRWDEADASEGAMLAADEASAWEDGCLCNCCDCGSGSASDCACD